MSLTKPLVCMAWVAALCGVIAPSFGAAKEAPAEARRRLATAKEAPADARRRLALRTEAIALEHGEGVPRDRVLAAARYCEAARLGDAESQYNLGWMYANGRGIERDDALAAFFFHAAAEQGLQNAAQMLQRVGAPGAVPPPCMRGPLFAGTHGSAAIRAKAPKPLLDLVNRIAPEYQVHPQLALTIMEAESRFNPAALSPKKAMGLMQLIPETSARFKVSKPYDPAQNIRGGVAYLRWLLAYFEGDVALVAAAYNAGEGTVDRYVGVPPYAETRAYVQRVLKGVGIASYPFDASATPASPKLALMRRQTSPLR
jgi:soluble lytic murein transglycosylase-like protein